MALWEVIVFAIVAIVIGGVVVHIVVPGLFTQQKNVAFLSSCKNLGGICKEGKIESEEEKPTCGPNEAAAYKVGCPDDVNGDGKIDVAESKRVYCCISKK